MPNGRGDDAEMAGELLLLARPYARMYGVGVVVGSATLGTGVVYAVAGDDDRMNGVVVPPKLERVTGNE